MTTRKKSLFSKAERKQIRKAYKPRQGPTLAQLATKWGTTAGTICRIVNSKD